VHVGTVQRAVGDVAAGRASDPIVIKVPVGTEILSEDQEEVLADLSKDGQRIVFLRGGDGGFGNAHYKSSVNQAPRKFLPGWPGEERWVWLRLKLIADAGIVGLPNAGKSTFLAATSKAKPKIADYPFTTLHPNLGVVAVDEYSFVLADIPGLIEGAHEGVGLGTKFLAHVERTNVLLHLIDITSDDTVRDYHVVRTELAEYGHGLAEKPEVVALNKIDALPADEIEAKKKELGDAIGQKIFAISAAGQLGVKEVLRALWKPVAAAKERAKAEAATEEGADGA
jgi:GTP-binding protein